jgi:hypothetical protein
MVSFIKMYTLYMQKEQTAVVENDKAKRKSLGHIAWIMALGRYCTKEDPANW